jgi:hypothetical protein
MAGRPLDREGGISVNTQTMSAEERDLHQAVDTLSEDARVKLAHYVAFLRYEDWIEEREEAEDIAYIEAHRDDPVVPFDLKEFEGE